MYQGTEVQQEGVNTIIDLFLRDWTQIRQNSDRNLGRNRPYYIVHPNEVLSPILEDYERTLKQVRWADAPPYQRLKALAAANSELVSSLLEFQGWLTESGALIDFDPSTYEAEAVKRGQAVWRRHQQELMKL